MKRCGLCAFFILAFLASGAGLSGQAFGHALKYKTYVNPRFRYAVSYPSVFVAKRVSADGDGRKFFSRRSSAVITVYASNNVFNKSIRDLYFSEVNQGEPGHPHGLVTFKEQQGNWFVISGTDHGMAFYEKTILYNGAVYTLLFDHPEDLNQYYAPILTTVSASFHPIVSTAQ